MPSDDDYQRPDYPEILTKKDWDRKKGKIAKMAGKTGMGAQLEKLEKAYSAVAWDKLEMVKNCPKLNAFKLSDWDKMLKDAESECKGNLKKFSQECYKTRDHAKGVAAEFKKSKTIPKSSTKHAEDIAKTADFMGVATNLNSMGSRLEKMYARGRKPLDLTRDVVLKKLPGLTDKALTMTAAVKKDSTKEAYNSKGLRTAVRDVTQNVGNIPKLINAGYPIGLDASACKKLTKQLAVFGDSEGPYPNHWKDDVTESDIKGDLTKLETALKAVKIMCGKLQKA